MPATILVVDDEVAIRRLLRNTLEQAGHAVVEARDGRDALARGDGIPVLLDLGLPDRDGLGLIPLLRRPNGSCWWCRRATRPEKVAALDLGADDYVTKPFDSEELLARLRVALRHARAAEAAPTIVRTGDLAIDLDRRLVTRGGEQHLTRKEYDVLAVLARHPGRVVTHDRIIDAAWGGDEDPPHILRIVVRNLRQKLEAPQPVGSVIANELGVGYRLRVEGSCLFPGERRATNSVARQPVGEAIATASLMPPTLPCAPGRTETGPRPPPGYSVSRPSHPVRSVSTSAVFVTATVCSNCADSFPSSVTTVQPSSPVDTLCLPWLIIGSMVKVMPSRSTAPVPGRKCSTLGSSCISRPMPWPQ
jgi:two-component system KDP operon response regulator KdpE